MINKKYQIVTFKDNNLQQEIRKINSNVINQSQTHLDSISIIVNNNNQVISYYVNSQYNLHNMNRQPASILKPLAVYLPWMRVERCTFIYHYFPILPFAMLSTAYMLVYVKNHIKFGKWFITGYFVVVAALFVIFFPALTGIKVSENYISNWLLWFFPAWWF